MTEFYKSEKVTPAITAIRSLTGEIMYLVEGEEKAALIDTCLGVGHLRSFVEKLTKKPITVILTHGHIDHAMGAPEFDDVYMNSVDRKMYLGMRDIVGRKGYIENNMGSMPDFEEDDFVQPSDKEFKELKHGDCFDLGGIHLDVYALPGHTQGTMVILVREERILILGDACNNSTFLFDENSSTVEEYKEQLLLFKSRIQGTYERVFLCHHQMDAPVEIIDNVIEVCDIIMEGKADNVPFQFMGNTYYIAKSVGERFCRLDGKSGNVIYNKNKVRKS